MLYLLDIFAYYIFKFQCTVMVIMDLHPSLYMYQESLQKRGVKVELVVCKQEAHGPHRSPEKTVQINKHI